MAGFVTAKYILAMRTFAQWHREIVRILTRKAQVSSESDDADLIVTDDWQSLLKPARDLLAAHIARKDNPHQETIESIGSYSATTIRGKLARKLPNGILPISSYGVVDELTEAQLTAAWVINGWTLTTSIPIISVLGGTLYRVPPTTINLRSAAPDPSNKTFYVFARLELGFINMQVRTDSPPESETIMYIGKITTNASGITSKQFVPVIRIETFRLSALPVGSAIPMTGGSYENPVKLSPDWNP